MSHQNPLTVIVPISKDMLVNLRNVLEEINQELIAQKHVDFENLGTIHYCRWIILEEADTNGQHYFPQLAFSSNFDGELDKHITDLASGSVALLMDRIYECCEGYPAVSSRNTDQRIIYFKKWMVKPMAFYRGAPGRSITQIKQESILRNHLRNILNSRNWQNVSAKQVHQEFKKSIAMNPEFDWAKTSIPLPKLNWPELILLGLILLILLPVIIIWVLIVHFFYERHDVPLGLSPSQIDEKHMLELEEYEDLQFQNQFTQVLEMKPGRVRLITVKAFMLLATGLIRFLFIENNLMGIPTIHFARWLMIDNNKRMLFLSNFDGSWQQYLGDFIDKSGWGLTAIWSNTVGFPKTNFLVTGGAYDAEHFLAWSRYYEIKTQVWYSAYPHLSIKNIVNNSHIRVDVMKDLDEDQAQQFLKRF